MAPTWVAWAACAAGIVLFQFVVSRRWDTATARATAGGDEGAQKSDLHLQRKLQHAATGLMIYGAAAWVPLTVAVTLLLVFAGVFYVLYWLRGINPRVDEAYVACFYSVLRREELSRKHLPGSYYFLLGCAAVIVLFPLDTARLAILHLSIGDPAASLIGNVCGRRDAHRRFEHGKTWQGTAGCWLVTALSTAIATASFSPPWTPLQALLAGLCAALAERVHLGFDDNLSLPLISALLLTLGACLEVFPSPVS